MNLFKNYHRAPLPLFSAFHQEGQAADRTLLLWLDLSRRTGDEAFGICWDVSPIKDWGSMMQ